MSNQIVEGRLQLRKRPRQERSIQRLDAIMEAAESLILEKGVAAVTMSEIAQRAGIPIGSLYQFFPQKAAIVKALHDRLSQQLDIFLRTMFTGVHSIDAAAERAADSLFELYALFRREPIYISLWQAVATDADLSRLSASFHDHLIRSFHRDLSHLVPEQDFERFRVNMKLMFLATGEIMRFASRETDEDARTYLSQWHRIIRSNIFAY